MNKNMFTSYLNKCLLIVKQIPAHVGNPSKKFVTRDKTKPLSFQRVGPKSEQLDVTKSMYLIVPSRMKKC